MERLSHLKCTVSKPYEGVGFVRKDSSFRNTSTLAHLDLTPSEWEDERTMKRWAVSGERVLPFFGLQERLLNLLFTKGLMVMFWFYLTCFFLDLTVYRPFSVGGIAWHTHTTDPANTVFTSNRNIMWFWCSSVGCREGSYLLRKLYSALHALIKLHESLAALIAF